MLQFSSHALGAAFAAEEVSEIELFRSRQRLQSRGLPPDSPPSARTDDLAMLEPRRRKTPAKWWHQQQQIGGQHEDGRWPEPAGTEMRVGFNAFDSSASPEVFGQSRQPAAARTGPCERECRRRRRRRERPMTSAERAVTSMGFPVLEWAPGLPHPSTLSDYAPLQLEPWASLQRHVQPPAALLLTLWPMSTP
ncbi:unnamed protein product [Phytophthora fragariaefolia]|uniref:Unnamed protein product n=1 Tax=Phytophthora fragariaefolia TaxID=1490495 RepID=A0A9W6UDE8_9STRA|nr:unnamed protein product [Phytophthora fragariaefolia]